MEKRGPIPKATLGLSHELYVLLPTHEHSHVKIKEINNNRKNIEFPYPEGFQRWRKMRSIILPSGGRSVSRGDY